MRRRSIDVPQDSASTDEIVRDSTHASGGGPRILVLILTGVALGLLCLRHARRAVPPPSAPWIIDVVDDVARRSLGRPLAHATTGAAEDRQAEVGAAGSEVVAEAEPEEDAEEQPPLLATLACPLSEAPPRALDCPAAAEIGSAAALDGGGGAEGGWRLRPLWQLRVPSSGSSTLVHMLQVRKRLNERSSPLRAARRRASPRGSSESPSQPARRARAGGGSSRRFRVCALPVVRVARASSLSLSLSLSHTHTHTRTHFLFL